MYMQGIYELTDGYDWIVSNKWMQNNYVHFYQFKWFSAKKHKKLCKLHQKIFKKNKKLQHNQVILATTKEKEKNFQY